ncbi:hypothetical protein EIN_084180 [Entamoeba invadens IP1]|uniref:hypothetical protein n=1 Tax=Entamoeba invadens IP1 TaxID=370355 RepID=UPI0002C3E50E|nr:hypothetical protein EIN_084180 [Entamoeba invadens IP1]ELP85256.1 hypothetical protein EIN_084180 [Entamoeba invadens IP1]|eukprot:XP_004184602.1 hypothetical protein EIN_084180 [Entamoeba invadens IP1]
MDLESVLAKEVFPITEKNKKAFLRANSTLLKQLPKTVKALVEKKTLRVANVIKTLELLPPTARMLKTLHALISIEKSATDELKVLKELEAVLSVSSPIEVKALKCDPLLFYDYLLINAQKIGKNSQIYALLCFHYLVVNHELNVPNFLELLYCALTPKLLTNSMIPKFFDRLTKYLVSSYIPSYASAAFVKKVMRLTLEAPTGAIIFLLTFALKMFFALPKIRFLLNRPTVELYKLPDNDPFETEEFTESSPLKIDLRETKVEQSFLWEHMLLMKHPHPKVALLAQSFPNDSYEQIKAPPEFNMENIDPKVSPVTTLISTAVNPFLITDNKQGVNEPSKEDCAKVGIEFKESIFDATFD